MISKELADEIKEKVKAEFTDVGWFGSPFMEFIDSITEPEKIEPMLEFKKDGWIEEHQTITKKINEIIKAVNKINGVV
jgi:hypothetical protein